MGRLILITGGSRSGKSDYALGAAEAIHGPHAFVATCSAEDNEMRERIKKHQESRDSSVWSTIEEPLRLTGVLRNNGHFQVFLIDCLTLWVSNMMFDASKRGQTLSEAEVADRVSELLQVVSEISATTICVTNEVGWGIVPEDPVSRLFRDVVGRCNQIVAGAADEVILVSCGIPLKLKTRRAE